MKKWLVASLLLTCFTLSSCSDAHNEITGEKPPEAMVEVRNQSYETILGSYCWGGNGQSTCVDTAGQKNF
ncbi:hypothetical protein [Oceanobacillus luteolus]|uniref:Lipoprotein n=1 Tax=Oceanobacillus luteolus TaxID=1274358 RepID=A0ABW4HQG9_9BACI